jgi:ADP-heptose:LPS heptosyltransferase
MTVLVLRALGLGDFLTGLPALALLRSALPEQEIVLAVPRQFKPLARLAGTVDRTIHGHELTPLVDAPRHADLAVDLHGNGPASRRLLLDREPRRLVAFNIGGPVWDPQEHEVRRWCRLVTEGLPYPCVWPSVVGSLPVPPGRDAPEGVTVVHPGAKSAARCWPPERFAAVAATLRDRGHDVVISAGPGEEPRAEAVAAASGTRALSGLSLASLLAVIAHARLVVCGDTGVAHAASNYRTPSVVLFGPVSPTVWGPPPEPRHQALWRGGAGDPHGDRPDPSLLGITVDDVAQACDRALAAAG